MDRFALPPVFTASTWATLVSSLWGRSPRGMTADDDGTAVPRWTSREAVAVVAGMRAMARLAGDPFPLWYQFAAVAYGWDPGGSLDNSDSQADREYPAEAGAMLGAEFKRIAGELDRARVAEPRVDLDDVFGQATFQQTVGAALAQDGAKVEFKIPLPACKDPRTGKPVLPVRGPDGKLKCPGGIVTVDDPVTAIVKSLSKIAVPLAIILIAAGALKTRRGRRRKR